MSGNDQPAPFIDLRQATRAYAGPAGEIRALDAVDLTIPRAAFVAVIGRSGSGKSTLVNLIAGLDRPSAGEVWVAGKRIDTLGEDQLAGWRGRNVGVVFQFFQLLPTLTIVENVMLPMDFCATRPPRQARAHALALLDRVGIVEQADKLPAALSGGQQQRAAIARALANDPPLIVADEPTGNLDAQTAELVLDQLGQLCRDGRTVLMVTHEREVSRRVDRVVSLSDGRVVAGAEAAHGPR
jgi:putative ABC transport system ATP-binding protein